MLTIVLVDDELSCLEDLSLALNGKANILGKFTNPLEAVEKIRELQPSAAFLDIEMPGIDGFATAYEMLAISPDIGIVFVTAHGECALKAFEIDADDFVVKPFCPERLAITVQRLEKNFSSATRAKLKTSVAPFTGKSFATSRFASVYGRTIIWY